MTAYSFKSYALRDRGEVGEKVHLLTIKHNHVLNNPHRAPFSSGATAARGLMVHAQRQLADPENGPNYFNQLRQEHDRATINGENVRKRLLQRQARAATALSQGDVDLTKEQLELSVELAAVQADLANYLIPGVIASGRSADAVIDDIDAITRTALSEATIKRHADMTGEEVGTISDWKQDLEARLAAFPHPERTDGKAAPTNDMLVSHYADIIERLEAQLPTSVARDEPLYEIDEEVSPHTLAQTRDNLSEALRREFGTSDLTLIDSLTDEQRQRISDFMIENDAQTFDANRIRLSPTERVGVGMSIIHSTPPMIKFPETDLGTGRYDVRMGTEEEAVVMDTLIRWAGEARTYPGPELANQQLEAFKSLSMPTGDLGVTTYGLAVTNNTAAISHASNMIKGIPADARIIIFADTPEIAAQLRGVREDSLAAAGIDRVIFDGQDANRDFGGWTLPGNNDRVLGDADRDVDVFVAASDLIIAYNPENSIDITSRSAAEARVESAKADQRSAEAAFKVAEQQMLDSRDPKLVAAAELLVEAGQSPETAFTKANASARPGPMAAFTKAHEALTAANAELNRADKVVDRLDRQNKSEIYARSNFADIAHARITAAANRQGKLHQVYVNADVNDKSIVKTSAGALKEQKNWEAVRKAEALLSGDTFRNRELRDALGAGLGSNYNGRASLTSTLVAGSNFFSEQKGAKKGLAALDDRLDTLPKNGVILVDDNERNPVVQAVMARGRQVIHATAWRVSEHSVAISEGRQVTISERSTRLDLGVVAGRDKDGQGKTIETGRARKFDLEDLKGRTVVIHGGGQMSLETFEAIQKEAAAQGQASHGLTSGKAMQIYNGLLEKGMTHLDPPRPAENKLARAIMQEALVDFADQAIIGSDMGRDYHSANLIRQTLDTDKLAAVIDKNGNAVSMEAARDHSIQYALSIADNTRMDLKDEFSRPASSDYGQLILSQLPGVGSDRAHKLGEEFKTLGDIINAAENGDASPALPRTLHHELSRPASWANAVDKANDIVDFTEAARMDGISASSEFYPEKLKETGRTPMLYSMADVDLNVPTMGLIVGGKSHATEADLDAVKNIAAEAHAKGWAVSLHLSGDASADAAKAIAAMPEEQRPRILLIGDGHPLAHGNSSAIDAVVAVAQAGGGYVTATAPKPHENASSEQIKDKSFNYAADRIAALNLQARQASAVVVVKSTGNDIELLALRTAIEENKPVASVGPVQRNEPTLGDLRYRGPDYSANRRLLAGGDSVSVMLENRHLAFQPNFVPDMTAQTQKHYVRFEGSTEGKEQSNDRNRQNDEIDRSAVESGSRIETRINWGKAADNIGDGTGAGQFIDAVVANEIETLKATQEQIAKRSLENDARFLDTSSRAHATSDLSVEVREVFSNIAEANNNDIEKDLQEHFLMQKAGRGR